VDCSIFLLYNLLLRIWITIKAHFKGASRDARHIKIFNVADVGNLQKNFESDAFEEARLCEYWFVEAFIDWNSWLRDEAVRAGTSLELEGQLPSSVS